MSNQQAEIISPEVVEIEEWNSLISSGYFNRLIDFINNRISKYSKEADKLNTSPSLDTSYKVTAVAAKKEELTSLLRKFEFYKEQYRLNEISKQKRGN